MEPITPLPAPSGGTIRRILHVADLHIRAGEGVKSRYSEYEAVFDTTFAALRHLGTTDDLAIVVAGDLFHHKDTISPPGMLLSKKWLRELSAFAPVYVIRGNHDYRQDIADPYEPDLVGALLEGEDPGRIAYLNHTGLYESGGVGFGLLAIQDALLAGHGSGRCPDAPPFPDPRGFSSDVVRRVALFHGPVAGCRLQTGMLMPAEECLAEPEGYDWALLGDIHLQQVRTSPPADATAAGDADGLMCDEVLDAFPDQLGAGCRCVGVFERARWGYPGSLIQQNFGEPLLGHGFLLWDVPSGACAAYHVANPWGMVTLGWRPPAVDGGAPRLEDCFVQRAYSPTCAGIDLLDAAGGASVPEMRAQWWFPERVRVRVSLPNGQQHRWHRFDLGEALRERLDLQVLDGVREHASAGPLPMAGAPVAEGHSDGADAIAAFVASVNSPDTWSKYVQDQVRLCAAKSETETDTETDPLTVNDCAAASWWEELFRTPASMRVPVSAAEHPFLPEAVLAKADERNKKLDKLVADFELKRDAASRGSTSWKRLALLRMEWDWVLCYRDGCCFDFAACDGHLAILSGANATGKSALLDILVFALFGQGMPSREAAGNAASLICTSRPPQKRARVSIRFRLGDESYTLKRSLDAQDNSKLTSKDVKLVRHCGTGEDVEMLKSKGKVDEWVSSNIGEVGAFLRDCLVSQSSDGDFFAMSGREQLALLDSTMSLQVSRGMCDLLKEARLASKSVAEAMEAAIESKQDARADLRKAGGPDTHEDAMNNLPALARRASELEATLEGLADQLQTRAPDAVLGRHVLRFLPPSHDYQLLLADFEDEALPRQHYSAVLSALGHVPGPERPGCTETELEDLRALVARHWPGDDDFEGGLAACRRTHDGLAARAAHGEQRLRLLTADLEDAQARQAELVSAVGPPPTPPRCAIEEMRAWPDDAEADDDATEAPAVPPSPEARKMVRSALERLRGLPAVAGDELCALLEDRAKLLAKQDKVARLLQQEPRRPPGPVRGREELEAYGATEMPEQAALVASHDLVTATAKAARGLAAELAAADAQFKRSVERYKTTKTAAKDDYDPDCAKCQANLARHHPKDELLRQKDAVASLRSALAAQLEGAGCADAAALEAAAEAARQAVFWRSERARWTADDEWLRRQERLAAAREATATALAQREADIAMGERYEHGMAELMRLLGATGPLPPIAVLAAALDAAERRTLREYRTEERRRHAAYDAWNAARATSDERLRQAHERVLAAAAAQQQGAEDARGTKEALQACGAQMERAEALLRAQREFAPHAARLRELDAAWARWKPYDALTSALRFGRAQEDHRNATRELARTRERLSTAERYRRQLLDLDERLDALKARFGIVAHRASVISRLCDLMNGFKSWAYTYQQMPFFCAQVNRVLAKMSEGEDVLRLEGELRGKDASALPYWGVSDGSSEHAAPPYEKASGFQRSLCSFATRLALARLSATTSAACAQLFIDEGFVACDAANIERVPSFLRGLLTDGLYDSIVLVTHLEALAQCATMRIQVQRDHHLRLSHLRWGGA